MNTLLTFWLYGNALVLVAYWSVVISQLRRGAIPFRDLIKGVGISLLAVLLWPYFLVRWIWMLLRGDLTRDVILAPLENAPREGAGDAEEGS
jgi:hypothetical protein